MTPEEKDALIKRVVADAKRERSHLIRAVFGAIFAGPYRAFVERRVFVRPPGRRSQPHIAR